MEEELETAFELEIGKLEFLFESFELLTPTLGWFARHGRLSADSGN